MKNLLLELLGLILQAVLSLNSLLQNKVEISDNKGIFYYPFTVSLKIYSQASACEHSYVWMLLIALWDCRRLKKSVVGSEIYLLTSIFSICCNTHSHTHTCTCTCASVSKHKVTLVVKMSETDLAKSNLPPPPFPFHKPV